MGLAAGLVILVVGVIIAFMQDMGGLALTVAACFLLILARIWQAGKAQADFVDIMAEIQKAVRAKE
jgi:hypothetical protein